MRYLARGLFGIALAILSWGAAAQSCQSALSCYNICVTTPSLCISSCGYPDASYIVSNHPECFGGSAATAAVQISSTSFQQVSAISSALSARLLASAKPAQTADSGIKSMAAGNVGKGINVWANMANNDTRQSYISKAAATVKNDSDILNTVIGADYALSPSMVLGVSGAFDRGDGQGSNNGTVHSISSKGYLLAPYVGMQLSKELALDASAGFGSGKLTTAGNTTAEADRWFAAANLGYASWINNIQLTGKLSYLHGEEKYRDSKTNGTINVNTAATNKIDQLRGGVQVGYWMNGFMPYAGLTYVADVGRRSTLVGATDPIGKDAFVWTLGVNLFSLSSGVTGGVAYNQEEGRTNQKNNSLIANIGFRF